MSEFQLDNAPSDAISSIKFAPKSQQYLIASSWDNSVRLYDISGNKLLGNYKHEASVLDCCMIDNQRAFSGGLDRTLKTHDFNAQKEFTVGTHNDAIRSVHFSQEMNLIITGSWDKHVKLWDIRMSNCVASHEHPDKVYSLDACEEKLVVGTSNRKIRVWDLRNMRVPEQSRDSSLRYQIRCVKCFPNKQGFALSSIEGRVAVEYFDMHPEVQKKKYAFKCHRVKGNDVAATEMIHPVNAISFHNSYNTFATGGSDGIVNIWDGLNKKRLCQFHPYPTGITSLCFSHNGSVLVIASSYNYERGQVYQGVPKDEIYVRHVSDLETKPK